MARKPRVLVLATTFPKSLNDGTPSFVLDLAREHSKQYDVWVLAPIVPGAEQWETIDNVKISRFRYLWPAREDLADGSIMDNLRRGFYQRLQLPFLLASFSYRFIYRVLVWRPDVIHAHWIIPGGLVGKLAPWIPRVVTTHGGDVYALNSKLLKSLKRLVLKNAKVTAVNQEMKQLLISNKLTDSVEIIPMGVKMAEQNKTKKPRQVIFVGRLVEKKGLEYLLSAVRDIECQLIVIGDGPLRDALESSKPENALFMGQKSKQEVLKIIAESDLMVIPSVVAKSGDREGLPVTLMEAAVSKTAVVATNMSGINDVIEHGVSGLLVSERNVSELKEAIEKVLTDASLRASLAENLNSKAKEFDIEVIANKYLEVLREVQK